MTTVYQPQSNGPQMPQAHLTDEQINQIKQMQAKNNAQKDLSQVIFSQDLDAVLNEIRDMLLQKNAAYGDSALNPVRIFSKAPPLEQLKVRMDDKLSRLARGDEAGEDCISDLLGYLVIYKIQQNRLSKTAIAQSTSL